MTRLASVEWFKLRKRMMTWVLALLAVGFVILLYTILWSVSGKATARFGPGNRFSAEDLRRALFLSSSVPFSLEIVGTFGSVLAVIFAAGAVGSEYAWGTVRLMATAASGRIRLLTAKLFVVFVLVAAAMLLAVAVGLFYSWVITETSGGTSWDFLTWPFVWDQVQAFGRTLFVLTPYVALAFSFSVIGRSTLAGVGAGLGIAFIGPLIGALMRQGGEPWQSIPNYLLTTNSQVILAQTRIAQPLPRFGPGNRELLSEGAPSPETAALILLVYVVVFVALALFVYRRRDITAN
jgi:ABC-2 type transport system permease protein